MFVQVQYLRSLGGVTAHECNANFFGAIFDRNETFSLNITWTGRPRALNRLTLKDSRLATACYSKFFDQIQAVIILFTQ